MHRQSLRKQAGFVHFTFQPLRYEQAQRLLNWRYPPPYDRYNFATDNPQEDLRYLLDTQNAFHAILNNRGAMVGFCSFGPDGQVSGGGYHDDALDIGLGICPDLVGQGHGKQYAAAVANYGATQYKAQRLRVTIAAFNQRAQRVWLGLGFQPVERFIKVDSEDAFVVMSRSAREPRFNR